MKVLLKKATIIDPESTYHQQQKDILINSGRIVAIEDGIEKKDDFQCIAHPNLHVSQGWFDPAVSFGEPGYEERETLTNGLQTAAKSGFTEIILNSNTKPIVGTHADVSHVLTKSQGHTTALYASGTLTEQADGKHMAPLYDMHLAGAIAFGDYKKHIENSSVLKVALEYVQGFKGTICSYPSDTSLRGNGMMHEGKVSVYLGMRAIPHIAEAIAITRDLQILKHTGGRLHFHFIATVEGVDLIRQAKKEGLSVSCSVALPHLVFTDQALKNFDANFKLFPPLCSKADREALRQGLLDGTIDMVSCMHEPVNTEQKDLEFAYALDGTIALESAFGVLRNLFPLEAVIAFLTRGRRFFGIQSNPIQEEVPANMTLFNPDVKGVLEEKDIYSTSKNCAFLGTPLSGKVYGTLRSEFLTSNTDE